MFYYFHFFFFQAEDGIRDLVRSRGLGDVYKRQDENDWYAFAQSMAIYQGSAYGLPFASNVLGLLHLSLIHI